MHSIYVSHSISQWLKVFWLKDFKMYKKNVKLLYQWHHGFGSSERITQTVKIYLKKVIPATFDLAVFLCFLPLFLANYFSV